VALEHCPVVSPALPDNFIVSFFISSLTYPYKSGFKAKIITLYELVSGVLSDFSFSQY
jgi:hypothetical protein